VLQNMTSVLSSSLSMEAPLQMGSKEVKPVEPKAKDAEPLLPDPPSCALPENKEPILPLPKQAPQSVCWNFCCCLNTDNLLSVIILIIFWVCIIFYSCLDLLVN
jgi:hypothetical protein